LDYYFVAVAVQVLHPIAAMVTIHKNTVDNIAKSNKKDKLEKKYFIELI
jgi:hypothetical protein